MINSAPARRSVWDNLILLVLSQIVQFTASTILLLFLANKLGAQQFGLLSLAVSLANLILMFADNGINWLAVKEIAANPDSRADFIRAGFTLKALLVIPFLSILVIYLFFMQRDLPTWSVIILIGISFYFQSLTFFLTNASRGFERMDLDMLASLIVSSLLLLFVGIAWFSGITIIEVSLAYLAARFLGFIATIFLYKKRFPGYMPGLRLQGIVQLSVSALPFCLFMFFAMIYSYIDVIILDLYRGLDEVGQYQAAFRIVMALVYFSGTIVHAFLPNLSRLYKESIPDFIEQSRMLNRALYLVVTPIVGYLFFMSGPLIRTFLTDEYLPAIPLLAILAAAYAFESGPPPSVIFITIDRLGVSLKVNALCAVVNIVLNIIFIPRYGALAAAGTTLFTFALMKLIYSILYYKELGILFYDKQYLISLGLTLLLGYASLIINDRLGFIAGSTAFGIGYILLVYFVLLNAEEKQAAVEWAKSKLEHS